MTQLGNRMSAVTQGKGAAGLAARVQSLSSRYGLTVDRMDCALTRLADLLRAVDGKATLPLTSVILARHPAVVSKYEEQGFEFAAHGLVHIDYSQLSLADQRAHLKRVRSIFDQAGLKVVGFRCPYLRWNTATLAALREHGFGYDSSQALAWDVTDGLETEAYRRVLAFYGAQSVAQYPSLPRLAEGIVRIPYCLPDDEALVERLRLIDGEAMTRLWLEMLHRAHSSDELLTLGLHPERVALCEGALSATLEAALSLSPAMWIARLDEIAAWWQARTAARVQVDSLDDQTFRIRTGAPDGTTVQVRAAEVSAPTAPWADGFEQVLAGEFTLRAPRRPLIGVSPQAAPALVHFLREQGYIVETGVGRYRYAYYVDQAQFEAEQERRLLAQIESADFPLVRLGRWPDGKRGALAITGDIDALTLWDYALRLVGK